MPRSTVWSVGVIQGDPLHGFQPRPARWSQPQLPHRAVRDLQASPPELGIEGEPCSPINLVNALLSIIERYSSAGVDVVLVAGLIR